MSLEERLKDPKFRLKVKHAGIRLDFADQKWMMERIEKLEGALRLCAGVLSGADLSKSCLERALEATRDVLENKS
jgi:hypothetical protein